MQLQPPCQEISQCQLAQEITNIYQGLVRVEAKRIEPIAEESSILNDKPGHAQVKQDAEHWQALTALHRTLLHEHHDFFLASQHPSSGSTLHEITTKCSVPDYSMPARMWKHGIHNFLELLRRRLPLSIQFKLTFIYLAYQIIALLFKTVPGYKDTWLEYLGDLARYRMAIEEDLRDREIWTSVAKIWYCKAMGRSPCVGRLQHHLAIPRNSIVERMHLYIHSLASEQPFVRTRGSIMTPTEPELSVQEQKPGLVQRAGQSASQSRHLTLISKFTGRWLSTANMSIHRLLLMMLFAMPAAAQTPGCTANTHAVLTELGGTLARHWMSCTAFIAITLALVSGVVLGPLQHTNQGETNSSEPPVLDRWRRCWWAAWGVGFVSFVSLATIWLFKSRVSNRSRMSLLPSALEYWVGMIITTLIILLTGYYAAAPSSYSVMYDWIPLALSVSAWMGIMVPGRGSEPEHGDDAEQSAPSRRQRAEPRSDLEAYQLQNLNDVGTIFAQSS